MMKTFFLRFSDEDSCKAIFASLDAYVAPSGDTPGFFKQADHHYALDIIGIIYKGGEWDFTTNKQLSPPVAISGFHVNYACEQLPEALAPYLVLPSSPERVFAGLDWFNG